MAADESMLSSADALDRQPDDSDSTGGKSNLGYEENAMLFGLTRGRLALVSGDRNVTCCHDDVLSMGSCSSLMVGGHSLVLFSITLVLSGRLVPPPILVITGDMEKLSTEGMDDNDDEGSRPPKLTPSDLSFAKHGVKLSVSREVVGI